MNFVFRSPLVCKICWDIDERRDRCADFVDWGKICLKINKEIQMQCVMFGSRSMVRSAVLDRKLLPWWESQKLLKEWFSKKRKIIYLSFKWYKMSDIVFKAWLMCSLHGTRRRNAFRMSELHWQNNNGFDTRASKQRRNFIPGWTFPSECKGSERASTTSSVVVCFSPRISK